MSLYDYLGNLVLDSDTPIPQMYGAKADGVTDDATAIASAIEANKGGILYFPKGTYKISSSIKTYPSDQNFTHLIFHPQAKIVPSSQMDYILDIGGIAETWTRRIGADSRKKIVCGGLLIANNGNVSLAAVHISNNTGDVDMSFMDIHTKDCSALLLGDTGASRKSTDCYVHHCNMCHDNAENQVAGIVVQSYDNNFSDLRVNFHKNGIEVYGGGQYFDNVHTLATNKQTDGISFLANASVHLSHCYGDSEGTFVKAGNNALVVMNDCQYYSYWAHKITFFDIDGYAKIKARGLTLDCMTGYEHIGVKVPYSNFSQQFNKRNFEVTGLNLTGGEYVRDGDPLKGTQSIDGSTLFTPTTLTINTWYSLGSFAVDNNSWNNITFIANNKKTTVPVSVSCSNASNMSVDIGSGEVVTDDSGTYQLGFTLNNGGFDAQSDYPRINVYIKSMASGKKMQNIYVESNQMNPLSTHTTLPENGLSFYNGTPNTIITVNCDNGTVTT